MAIHVLSAQLSRLRRRTSWLFAVALLSALLVACGDSASDGDDGDAAAATSITTSDATDTTGSESTAGSDAGDATTPQTEAGTGGAVDDADVEQLRSAIDATIARNSASFTLNVVQTLPVAGANQASMLRRGSFDDQQQIGIGTQQFLGESVESAELPGYAGEELEYRLVDDTYWLLNPVSNPPSWIGYQLPAFAELSQGDPTLSVDGDLYLRTVSDAITSVTDAVEFDDGSQGWALAVDADALLPLVVTAGVQQRLVAAGLEPTDVQATVSIAVDPEGMVVGLIADLDEWWRAVLERTVGPGDAPAGMVAQFQIGDFDTPVEVETPCAAPEEFVEAGSPAALICED